MPSIKMLLTNLTLVLVCLFTISACSSFPISFHNNSSIEKLSSVKIAKQSKLETVALIRTDLDGDQIAFCTGVWISPTVILTANHCIEGYADMKYRLDVMKVLIDAGVPKRLAGRVAGSYIDDLNEENEMGRYFISVMKSVPKMESYGAEIPYSLSNGQKDENHFITHTSIAYKYDKEKDLALLTTNYTKDSSNNALDFALLGKKNPMIGEMVYQMGNTAGYVYSFKMGVVSAYRKETPESVRKGFGIRGPVMQLNCLSYMGDSGGGVFDETGKLVGILSFVNEEARIAYAIPLESIIAFFKD